MQGLHAGRLLAGALFSICTDKQLGWIDVHHQTGTLAPSTRAYPCVKTSVASGGNVTTIECSSLCEATGSLSIPPKLPMPDPA